MFYNFSRIITLSLECRQFIICAMITPSSAIYSSLNCTSAHLFHQFVFGNDCSSKKKTNGEKIEEREFDTDIRAPQTSHRLNDTQMTEVIKCSLCHCRISEALLLFPFCFSFHKSVSTLGSLKWQCV